MAIHKILEELSRAVVEGNLYGDNVDRFLKDEKNDIFLLSCGEGVPTHTDALLYIRRDGATEDTVLYIRDTTAGDWTAVLAP